MTKNISGILFHIFCDMTFHSILTLKVITFVYWALHIMKSSPTIMVPLRVSVLVQPLRAGQGPVLSHRIHLTNRIKIRFGKKKWYQTFSTAYKNKFSIECDANFKFRLKPAPEIYKQRQYFIRWLILCRAQVLHFRPLTTQTLLRHFGIDVI